MKITPETIAERHEQYPDATPHLIAGYAYQDYQKAILDLMSVSEVASHPELGAVVIVLRANDWNHWRAGNMSKHKHYDNQAS